MSDRVLQVEVRRGVTTLTLDSPADRNALSRAMRAQLRSALTAAIADDSVQVVVLDHTGWVFCSGTDLPEAANGVAEDRGVDAFPALLQMSPPALAETRRLLRAACTGPSAEQFPELLTSSARFSASEEGQEGIAAFPEERPTRWVPA